MIENAVIGVAGLAIAGTGIAVKVWKDNVNMRVSIENRLSSLEAKVQIILDAVQLMTRGDRP